MNKKPPIIISSLDLERIEALLDDMGDRVPSANANILQQELARAEVVDPQNVPSTTVTMNSTVRFEMLPHGEKFELTLVYPRDINGDPNRISVLAPVGGALLGLSVGQEIEWPVRGGNKINVRITEVTYQPERDGIFHR